MIVRVRRQFPQGAFLSLVRRDEAALNRRLAQATCLSRLQCTSCPLRLMAKAKSIAFMRIREEVIRLVGLIPEGKFTTYGSIAVHMNVQARHVAMVMSRLTEEEAQRLPWHRVVSADARLSPNMDAELRAVQRARLVSEGLKLDAKDFIQDSDRFFHVVGIRRNIRWSEMPPPIES